MNNDQNPTAPQIRAVTVEEQNKMKSQLNNFKVDQLKSVLSDMKLSKTGRKADLLARILENWRLNSQDVHLRRLLNAIEKAATSTVGVHIQRMQANPYPIPSKSTNQIVRTMIALPPPGVPRPNLPTTSPKLRATTIPILPAPLVPANTILIEGSILYHEIKTIVTVRVGAQFQKPPILIRFKLDDKLADLMEKLGEDGEQSLHRLILVCGRPVPSVISIPNPPASRIEYPSGTHASVNGIHLNTHFNCDTHVELTNVSYRGPNEVKLSYYHTPTPYAFALKLVKLRNEKEILAVLQEKKLTKEEILENRKKREKDDDDIIAGDEIVELLDPFSRCRIALPARGRSCKHTQCFDAFSYLQINKSNPKMECPICYSKLPLSQLVLDAFFEEILSETSADVEQVHVSLDGKWSLIESIKESDEANGASDKRVQNHGSDIVLIGDSPPKKKEPVIVILDSDDE